jgi:hypothetical protein
MAIVTQAEAFEPAVVEHAPAPRQQLQNQCPQNANLQEPLHPPFHSLPSGFVFLYPQQV